MQLGAASSITPATLRGLCRFLTNTVDNVAAFSDTNIDALLNLEQRTLQTEILTALNYDWKESTVDGTGSGSIALSAADSSYAFPTDMLQVDRIEISYTGMPNSWRQARVVPLQGMRGGVMNNSNDAAIMGSYENPIVFIRNKVLYLDPIPKQAVAGGLRVWGQTLVTDLSDTAHEPVFEKAFHEIIAYGPAATWCSAKENGRKGNDLLQKRMMKFKKMVEFYSTRTATEQPTLIPATRSMR
jgi:hypothetical protein